MYAIYKTPTTMPKEDYLLKYLEKLSRVIAAMLGLRDKGFPEDALKLADETYKELLSIHLEDIKKTPSDEFKIGRAHV